MIPKHDTDALRTYLLVLGRGEIRTRGTVVEMAPTPTRPQPMLIADCANSIAAEALAIALRSMREILGTVQP